LLRADARAERDQRVDKAEIVERLRPQLARDAAHLVEAVADRVGDAGQLLLRELWIAVGRSFGQQHDRGESLPDLVVQLAGDSRPLGLLRGERRPRRLAPGGLEPVEHRVEGVDERGALGRTGVDSRDPQPRPVRVNRAHHLREAKERRQHTAQQHHVEPQHRHKTEH
jgi:hypothetical protein